MTELYDPPANLNSYELQMIGQALNGKIANDLQNLKALMSGIRKVCAENQQKADDVFESELCAIKNVYRVLCRFVIAPLPWEMFENLAKEAWASSQNQLEGLSTDVGSG